ncbi:MAG: hypothetical protein CBC13_02245 [Planctomycetia bacterium TMED53]|nr:MAG: hypothetical protein CBC13_02245 [Planctomycetia bacterium TMED53]
MTPDSYGALTNVVVILLTVFYGSLITGELLSLRRSSGSIQEPGPNLIWLKLALLIHFGVVLIRGFEVGSCPVGSRWEAFSLLALLIAFLQWVLVATSKDRSTLLYGLSFAFVLQLGSAAFSLTYPGEEVPVLDSIRSLHAFSALLGLAGVSIAGIHGVLWTLLRRSIKKGHFGLLFNQLSSLESLSVLVKTATTISAITLTISVASAFILLDDTNRERSIGFESIATVSVWLIFMILALVPRSNNSVTVWRTNFSLVGFLAVLLVLGWISVNGFHAG